MANTPTFQDCPHALYHQQLQNHTESLLLLFLRSFCAEGASPACSGYRASHLRTIAQGLYVLQMVQCSAASRREEETSSSLLPTGGGTRHLGVCTERDLYYRNPPLFAPQGQRAAHASVERLCNWLEVVARAPPHQQCGMEPGLSALFRSPRRLLSRLLKGAQCAAPLKPLYTRESLGFTAAGRSLLAGAVILELCDPAEMIDVSARGSAGITLTYPLAARMVGCREAGSWQSARDGDSSRRPCKLILIEKESTHHAILQSMAKGQAPHAHSYVLLCTKGYPCVAARQWLRRAHALWPSLELYIMVDGDPHGLCIALTLMGLLGSKGNPPPIVSSSSPFGTAPVSAGAERVKKLLPLRFLGVCPSLVWGCRAQSEASLHAGILGDPVSSQGIPLTADDVQVLKRIAATLKAALASAPGPSESAKLLSECCRAIVRHTLQRVDKEVEWMQRSRIKCELQLACSPLGPLAFMEQHVQRCDAELSEGC
ncbi:hypothetical protein LSCM1_00294 [Leishmania martiniquensis]|uniref:Topoisomerase 6 subunit A/Spo11 TOPRIM domain-containing protein n=1 Tax=Leishmania martiniquensis TaxID=1580590 RepID=A0A836G0W6_9TRYP|nr:hypothetical protein LSCM1_00294 [Leishmania martiniquensis]